MIYISYQLTYETNYGQMMYMNDFMFAFKKAKE